MGPVFVEPPTGDLVAVYSITTMPGVHLSLQAELEGRANGTAQVIAACKVARLRLPVTADQARAWVRRWYAAGGKIKVGDRGWQLVQGFNADETLAEWALVRSMVFRLAFPVAARHASRRTRPMRRP